MSQTTFGQVAASPIEILIVDDDDDDVRLAKLALKGSRRPIQVHRAEDGLQALEYLKNCCEAPENRLPDLVLLDLNMPRLDGREFLQEVKNDQRLKFVSVIVLSTSNDPADILSCYQLQANCFIPKPDSIQKFRHVVKAIEDYWISNVANPTRLLNFPSK